MQAALYPGSVENYTVRMDKSAQGTQLNTQFSKYDDNQTKPWKYVYVQLVHVYLEPVWAEYRKKTGGTRVFCQTELEPVSLWLEEVDNNPLESSTASWSLQTLEFIMYISILYPVLSSIHQDI